jgi:hypothetical protein
MLDALAALYSHAMHAIIASTDSAAESLGYAVGVLIGIAIMIGFVVFAIVAVVKAFTRRTTGWIVAGSICGFFLLIPVLLFFVGMIKGFTAAGQRAATRPAPAADSSSLRTAASPPLRAPSTSQIVQGGDLAYTLSLPTGWTFKRQAEAFDVLASHRSLYVGVIAEEASLGSPETIAKIARDKLKNYATDLRWGEPTSLLLDGRSWLQFAARCQAEGIPVAYQFYVYSGPEGTYQVVGWTTQNLYDRDAGLMRDVMRTFRFPQ